MVSSYNRTLVFPRSLSLHCVKPVIDNFVPHLARKSFRDETPFLPDAFFYIYSHQREKACACTSSHCSSVHGELLLLFCCYCTWSYSSAAKRWELSLVSTCLLLSSHHVFCGHEKVLGDSSIDLMFGAASRHVSRVDARATVHRRACGAS